MLKLLALKLWNKWLLLLFHSIFIEKFAKERIDKSSIEKDKLNNNSSQGIWYIQIKSVHRWTKFNFKFTLFFKISISISFLLNRLWLVRITPIKY